MASAARTARTPPKPVDEARLILLTADALVRIMEELRRRLVHVGTPLAPARVLLAEAHILEAVTILRSIPPKPSAGVFLVPAVSPSTAA